jgi:hypothetical protein
MYVYRVKVTKDPAGTYLWGGDGAAEVVVGGGFYLIFRVDEFGEEIDVTREDQTAAGNPENIGHFKPGETYAVHLVAPSGKKIKGIKAVCSEKYVDTYVECAVVREEDGKK